MSLNELPYEIELLEQAMTTPIVYDRLLATGRDSLHMLTLVSSLYYNDSSKNSLPVFICKLVSSKFTAFCC